jgi:hypothetical protein
MNKGLKFKRSLVLVALLFVASLSLKAQEGNFSSQELQELKQHSELNLDDDKTLIMEVDTKPSKSMPSNGKETLNLNQPPKQKSESTKTTSKDKDEDPLNFNFLYFIIQRFKISDLIDD